MPGFGLGLPFELRLCDLDRNYGRQTLAEVVAVDIELEFGEHARILGVFLERAGQGAAETRQVRTAFDRVDIIDVGVYVLREESLYCMATSTGTPFFSVSM